jgi:hypothetical protein
MTKRENTFDEKAFLQAMSAGHRFGSEDNTPPVAEEPSVVSPPTPQADVPRRHKTKVSDYETLFLVPREPIEKRTVVGLRLELYEIIATIVKRIGTGVSAQAFVENVLREHLSEYQDEINRLNREKLKKDIL